MIRVVVFDFDGTLVDSNSVKRTCMDKVVAHMPRGPSSLAAARAIGGDRYMLFANVVRGVDPAASADAVERQSRDLIARYSACCARGIFAAAERRGARRTLAALRARGLRIWINSATPQRHLPELLRQRGLAPYFDGVRGGPASKTEILRDIMFLERAHAREILFVGDGPDDLAAARELRVPFVAITAENRIPGRRPFAMRDLTNLVALIDRHGARPLGRGRIWNRILLAAANALSLLWRILPQRLRHLLIKGLFVLESRGTDTGAGLKRLFTLQDHLEHVVNERALAHGGGEHPKHRLMRYHDFFVERVGERDRVLDVGCGYGAVARSIARGRPGAVVMGLDHDPGRLGQARAGDNPPNLSFAGGDATKEVPPGPWDVVVLSNVLEHIADRVGFLKALVATTGAKRFLIRVPLFERDWKLPMRREVGANYYSDSDHKIEPMREEFRAETTAAGLEAEETILIWGEIWSALRVAPVRR